MIAYKYKLYQNDKTKHLDKMLREASFVWNHALVKQGGFKLDGHKSRITARPMPLQPCIRHGCR